MKLVWQLFLQANFQFNTMIFISYYPKYLLKITGVILNNGIYKKRAL